MSDVFFATGQVLWVPHRSSLNQLTSSRSYFRVIRATITLIHLFYRCNSVLSLHPSVRLRSSIILRCGVRKKKTTLFLHFLCTSVRIGISYESTCFAFLYLPNPHRAFDNALLFSFATLPLCFFLKASAESNRNRKTKFSSSQISCKKFATNTRDRGYWGSASTNTLLPCFRLLGHTLVLLHSTHYS